MMDFGTYIAGREHTVPFDPENAVTEIFNGAVRRKANNAPSSFPDFDAVERFLCSIHASGGIGAARNVWMEYMAARDWLSEAERYRRNAENRTAMTLAPFPYSHDSALARVEIMRKDADRNRQDAAKAAERAGVWESEGEEAEANDARKHAKSLLNEADKFEDRADDLAASIAVMATDNEADLNKALIARREADKAIAAVRRAVAEGRKAYKETVKRLEAAEEDVVEPAKGRVWRKRALPPHVYEAKAGALRYRRKVPVRLCKVIGHKGWNLHFPKSTPKSVIWRMIAHITELSAREIEDAKRRVNPRKPGHPKSIQPVVLEFRRKVKAAILSLDPDTDWHWVMTGAHKGKPKIAAVVYFYGRAGLTRQHVEAVMPGYDRDAACEAALGPLAAE